MDEMRQTVLPGASDPNPQPSGQKSLPSNSSAPSVADSQSNRKDAARTTRSSGSTVLPTLQQLKNDKNQEIRSAEAGRSYLDKHHLLVPSEDGEELSLISLATTLPFSAEIKGTPLPARNAIRSVAFLMLEMDLNKKVEDIVKEVSLKLDREHDKLSSALNALTNEVKEKILDATTSAQESVNEAAKKLTNDSETATKSLPLQAPSFSYRDAVTQPADAALQTRIDPRVRAREGIRQRQVLVEFPGESMYRHIETARFIERFNRLIKKIDSSATHKVSTITRLRNGGVLLEMSSEEGAEGGNGGIVSRRDRRHSGQDEKL
jgi:hypothetical protein